MSEEIRSLITEYVQKVWTEGDAGFISSNIAEDFVPHFLFSHLPRDRKGFEAYVATFRTAFPDLEVELEDLVVEGDKAAFRWTAYGTHDGPLMGVPPTGESVRFGGLSLFRVESGQLAEGWAQADVMGVMTQIRAIDPPGKKQPAAPR